MTLSLPPVRNWPGLSHESTIEVIPTGDGEWREETVCFVMKFFTLAGEMYPEGTLHFLRVTDKAHWVPSISSIMSFGRAPSCGAPAVLSSSAISTSVGAEITFMEAFTFTSALYCESR